MSFLSDSLDLFTGASLSHMGAHQYTEHHAKRGKRSTSGNILWKEIEETHETEQEGFSASEGMLLSNIANDINKYVTEDVSVIDLGPGTVSATEKKTIPFLRNLNCKSYIPVDLSLAFLRDLVKEKKRFGNIEVRPIIDDFFSNDAPYSSKPSLACSFGSTISNIEHPISAKLPLTSLTNSLKSLSKATHDGWLLISFDTEKNRERIISYYSKHSLFQLNIFDRMAAELPLEGDFDPLNFTYVPVWVAASGQLAHTAQALSDMSFTLAGKKIVIQKGARLHLKNSYKYSARFFEYCATNANLEVIKSWRNDTTTKVYLLKKKITAATHTKFGTA